jgi:hypothetical protein
VKEEHVKEATNDLHGEDGKSNPFA